MAKKIRLCNLSVLGWLLALENDCPLKTHVARCGSFPSVLSPVFDTDSSRQGLETRYGFAPYCPSYGSLQLPFAL